jgi:hypothetical protein
MNTFFLSLSLATQDCHISSLRRTVFRFWLSMSFVSRKEMHDRNTLISNDHLDHCDAVYKRESEFAKNNSG